MSHARVGRSLLGLARSFKQLDTSDPLTLCLAPTLSRTFASAIDVPVADVVSNAQIEQRPHQTRTTSRSRGSPSEQDALQNPPRVLTTLHSWPTIEPTRFAWYDSQFLNVPLRKDLLHRAVIYEADSHRRGTASTKWRDEVHGSGRKLIQQKGTGRARVGDKKSPIRRGGGVAFGPKPRDFSTELQRKVYDKAWRTALSHRYRRGELYIIDEEIRMPDDTGTRFLSNLFEANRWGKGYGRSMLVVDTVQPQLGEHMSGIGEHGLVKDIEDVDVKDLLETGRIVIEKRVLDSLLLAHASDLDFVRRMTLERARQQIQGGLFGPLERLKDHLGAVET